MTELLLVGAGHAHLYVVTHAESLIAAGYRVRLLAPRYFHYSGVASATAAGTLPPDAGRLDVRALAEAAGVTFHEDLLTGLDLDQRTARTAGGAEIAYDVLSINIGSVAATSGLTIDPAVLRVKPLSELAGLDGRLGSAALAANGATVTVVGGGSTGLELAAHLAVHPHVTTVRLVESGPRVGADLPRGARRRMQRLLDARGIDVRTGRLVAHVGERDLRFADDTKLGHDVALLATGLVAPPLVAELGLGDERGVPVRATLQHVDRDEIYAAGDCAHFLPRPLPRVGVHGVRQGPVLHRSLLARLRTEPLPTYEPQRRALAILDLGAGVGLAVRGRWWWYGTLALRLKRLVDRRWLVRYRPDGQ
ncbi:pyridine nucleotide-disulfide oxidoreductase [Aeromicrobium sp. A1-2]|uniref:NAD(P)/FAD-dependent oxidoreductase n=1 Tax=Aeromicrobium sp. A1-2 TaxID=2107713 RepID=UPI000E4D15EC|nr:FAD-dependent oxidoreductase [Aeromicrobium sp. A1-2]AXT85619.1 pyridine nucleotide-disulfide oxidoreductase [Aeromicrobium sp. A1-2]